MSNVARLLSRVPAASVVHLGTPCSSFSTARRGKLGSPGGPIRSKLHPMGLPELRPGDAEKVKLGNKLLRLSVRVINLCCLHNIPVSLENPRRSRLWWTPCMLQRLRRGGHKVCLDFCRFGTPWQKSTTFAVWNTAAFDPLERRCCKHNGLCSSTNKHHQRLEGNAPGGKRWTLVAEPYPAPLCSLYASCADGAVDTANYRVYL